MTQPHAVIARISADVTALNAYLGRVSADLTELQRMLSSAPPVYAPPAPVSPAPPQMPAPPAPVPSTPRGEGWIGKLLAVAGVAVTLIGVVLLLVLAAQAGILRPEVRVAAGAVLAGALVAAAHRLHSRQGGRTGAVALAATGVAAAYMDVIAVTTIYEWLPAPAGLILAALIGGGGLTLARHWDAESLGLLVLVPLLILAPVVAGGVTLLLIAFMLAISAASLPVQLGRDWLGLHGARTAAASLPLLVALVGVYFDDGRDPWLAGACGIAALLAFTGALLLLPRTANKSVMAVLTAGGVLPVLCAGLAVDRWAAALMAAALAAALLAIVLAGDELPGVDTEVRRIWSVLAALSALVGVLVAFDGRIAGPVLLVMALLVAATGRRSAVARVCAFGFAAIGAAHYLYFSPPAAVMYPTEFTAAEGVSTLIGSVLVVACAATLMWALPRRDFAAWAGTALACGYAVTQFTVTAGVLIGGTDGGFFAGHMAATIFWIALAAALFAYAARLPRADRSLPIGAGLAVVAAAMAKLFLFDLGTLDGIFRVGVFIVVGLTLLGMGAGYARLLERRM
ncbi:DUF2339 domain-containing protein [Mycolicibacterium flavescens]|uniref:Membrane protein (DUF2339) n=1 Tax=Mycolicibacterium flavescens TaxID=1776 RepID=A0A1E3RQ47_MYCFV|nr:DUF2339 domain-containing protein [Mycolicibacterium flavescens]MCV7279375.1 DUF2339 domain-containing protein [Mycolicibacterium flavescens]ODQ92013.1 hypothetical protein BHQ18_03990 [Mycolicibacterium flavescens]